MSLRKPDPNSQAVYSTDSGSLETAEKSRAPDLAPASPKSQVLKLRLETKGRGGKAVTVIAGASGPNEAVEELARKLKSLCGAGGTVKTEGRDHQIEIQGDHRPKIATRLRELGFTVKGA